MRHVHCDSNGYIKNKLFSDQRKEKNMTLIRKTDHEAPTRESLSGDGMFISQLSASFFQEICYDNDWELKEED